MDIQYLGESLWQGQLGHFLLILSFAASFVALVSFALSVTTQDIVQQDRWRQLGKSSFIVHTLSVIGVIVLLYVLIFTHQYEYDYVRRHSNEEMSPLYMISCFWAGQQGSFLVWIFWHAIIGSILLFSTKKTWVAPVIAVFALIQLILSSMLLGIYLPRGIALLALIAALHVPFWKLLQDKGQAGWKALVPVLNLITVARTNSEGPKWLLWALALPINLIFFIWLPLQLADGLTYLTETVKLGVSPFALAREEFSDNAIFLFPNYLEQIAGQGLNPLLENRWMVIHPPTLFLGFALTLVPMAFAMAGIATKRYGDWIKPALPWTVLATMILGTGILMGGMWAYESLSFGGFWAWDPVENASLVPWLTLIAGMHTMLIYKRTGHALKATYLFFIVSVFLVLYSTFLTRSGILGDSSVHSFTDLGMMGQLIILIIGMMLPALIMMIEHWHKMPSQKKEESAYSREFWMFIGSLVLLISAVHIVFSTSLPVFNSIAAGINQLIPIGLTDNAALPKDVVTFYNDIQVWVGIAIALLTAMVQWLKYKKTDIRKYINWIVPTLILSLLLTIGLEYYYQFDSFAYVLLLFTGLFSVLANLDYIIRVLKGKVKVSGSAVAHIGFGLMMVGIIISLSKSEVISKNYMNIDYGTGFDEDFKQNNLYLLQDKTYFMGDYMVTFEGKDINERDYYYDIDYKRLDPQSGELKEEFTLRPHLLNHPDMGLVANPATKRYLHRDIFTHINSIPTDRNQRPLELPQETQQTVALQDSFFTSRGMVTLESIQPVQNQDADLAAVARLKIDNMGGQPVYAEPMFVIKDNEWLTYPAKVEEYKMEFEILNIDPDKGEFTVKVTDNNDWLILKAIVFPWINILWLGIVITMVGFMIAMVQRIQEYNRTAQRETA